MENKEKRFKNVISVLSMDLQSVLCNVPKKIVENVSEITLRSNRPLCVECFDKRYYFTTNNCVTDTLFDSNMVMVTQRSIFETFQNICNYSVYSRQNEINSGFITLKGGHRAGICGTAITGVEGITNIKNITSINIRIAREVIDCSQELYDRVDPKSGVLICGAPCSGKTTLIRDYARKLSYQYKVSVIDERNELSATVSGVSQNDMGMCDVFDSYKKHDAITHAVRNMSPDIIVCDEISTVQDVNALRFSVNSGVSFVATLHSNTLKSLLHRAFFKEILETSAFSTIVFLDSRQNVGKIREIVDADKLGGDLYV